MKGTIVFILPDDCDFPYQMLSDLRFPATFMDYLDGMINILLLPKGGSMHIGGAGVEVVGDIHKQIHCILDEDTQE